MKYFYHCWCWSDEEYGEKSVSVKVDHEEVELCFIDHPSNEMSVGDSRKLDWSQIEIFLYLKG